MQHSYLNFGLLLYISPAWSTDEVCFLQFILQQKRKLKIEVLRLSLL